MRLLLVLGALLAIPGVAYASDTHYQDYPVGGRAVGLGGAFVALANDPSGMYYNPAGIVDVKHSSVQLSTTLYGLEIADSFFAAVGRAANLDTIFTELNIIPSSSASFVERPHRKTTTGLAKTSYALGAFVPSFRSRNVDTLSKLDTDTSVGCDQISYQRSLQDRTLWAGGSIAHRLDERLRFGLSSFLVYRTMRDVEETSCFGDGAAAERAFASSETNLSLAVASVLFTFGLQLDVDERLKLGLTVSAPTIEVFDSADVRVRQEAANPVAGTSRFLLESLGGIEASSRRSTSVRLGGMYVIPRTATFIADLSLHAPTSYELIKIPPARRELQDALTIVTDVERTAVVNLNLGAEYLVVRWFSVAGGFYTNLSSAPDIPGNDGATFAEDRLPSVHTFGGSLVLGFFSDYTLTRIGLTMSYGSGTDVVPRYQGLAALGEQAEFVKIKLNQLLAFAFISSTFRY